MINKYYLLISIFLYKSYKFLQRFFLKNPLYTTVFAVLYCIPLFRVKVSLLNEQDLCRQLMNGSSFVRFGDGEIGILLHEGSEDFQEYDKKLNASLKKLIEYRGSNLIVGVPTRFITLNKKELETKRTLLSRVWLPFKVYFLLYFNKKRKYADAHIFYQSKKAQQVLFPVFKNKTLLFVTDKQTKKDIESKMRSLFFVGIWVVGSSVNAALYCDEITRSIDEYLEKCSVPLSDIIIVTSNGMASKILVDYYLHTKLQVIDVGAGAHYFFTEEALDMLL
jgi:hypothetical protein